MTRRANRAPLRSTAVAFLAWGAVAGRSTEIADALGGRAQCFFPPGAGRRPPVLVRYFLSTFGTVRSLLRTRPRVVVVTNPPIIPGILALAWARSSGGRVALDSHPGAFGAKDDRASARLLPVHRWLARQVDLSLVAAPEWQQIVESWGGRAMVVHEAPGPWQGSEPVRHHPLRVLYVGTFARDEPIEAVIEAAGRVPECELLVTGDQERCPPQLRVSVPLNVRFIGFLNPDAYRRQLEDADAVLTLTTEPNSVMRAAYEAVYAQRPLILSDWPIARQLFPDAIHTANDATALAAALRRADEQYALLVPPTIEARARQLRRWEDQRQNLANQLGLDVSRASQQGATPVP